MRNSTHPMAFMCCRLLLIPLAYGLGGCIGPGEMGVSFPPLQVEGKVVDKDGHGIDGMATRVMLSQRSYGGGENFVGEASAGRLGATVVETRTDREGFFKADFPGRFTLHPVALVGPFAIGRGTRKDLLLIVEEGEREPTEYYLHCHHERVDVRQILKREDGQLEAKKVATPSVVLTELDRSRKLNRLKVVITRTD